MKWRKQQMRAIQAIWALEKKNLATRYPWWDLWTILRPVSFGEYLTPLWRASINLSLGLEQLRDWKGSKRTNLDLPWSLQNNAKHPPWAFLRLRILGWAISYKGHVMNWVVREFLMKSQTVDVYKMPLGFEHVTYSGWISWKTQQLTRFVTNLWNYHHSILVFETSVHILYELPRWHTFTSSLWTSMTFTNWIANSLVSVKALLLFLRNGARERGGGVSQSHMFTIA